eukprot:TRINITY_DN2447_c0_g1_i4.p2 TRINITY_DN2447_c0_g1~~TRINITY_DN2447_c0_g1_i4.p2  ORF type:complete len:115 (-),score=5.71 TRINITY_DN2447_c0_g1_i4:149-493(-)
MRYLVVLAALLYLTQAGLPVPSPRCDGDFCWEGPSRSIIDSKGRATGVKWPEKFNSVEECAEKCENVADCNAFHYYDRQDKVYRDCYLHKGGIISPQLDDGRRRLAGVPVNVRK